MAQSKLRNSCSFPNLLLSFLNFILFLLSVASLALTIFLRMPPTSLGCVFIIISSISIITSFVGFYSKLTHFCFMTHISLLLTASIGQLLGFLALFTNEKSSLSMLKSKRDPREAKLLVRLECGVLMAMFVLQMLVLIMTCVVHNCWARDYECLEAERAAAAKKTSQRLARVQEESIANAAKMEEMKAVEFDAKMKNKYGQWV